MRIAYITAGAANMYCGSCLRDNTLARALLSQGHEVLLVPTYTPTRTDEPNVSLSRVFLGGINIYLQYKSAMFRHTPGVVDRLLDSPSLLNWAGSFGLNTDAADLGPLLVSMLQGEEGPDRKEFLRLAQWLAEEVQPDIVDLSNVFLIALAAPIRRVAGVPVCCTLSGEDLFLQKTPEPWRTQATRLLRRRIADVDSFITFNKYYAGAMADALGIPHEKLHQVPLGLDLIGHNEDGQPESVAGSSGAGRRQVIGYLARVCPEKGLHLLYEAFRILRQQEKFAHCRLRVAGYLGPRDRPYLDELQQKARQYGLDGSVEYVGELDRAQKIRFLKSLDVFSVPTVYRESKGLPVLEALANQVPVVQPDHGAFAELVGATQGGLLVPPENPQALAEGIARLLENPSLRRELGRRGRAGVEQSFTAGHMADATLGIYRRCLEMM